MKIIIERNDGERQTPLVTIDTKNCTYPYAIREALTLALDLDGYSAETIKEIFGQMPDTVEWVTHHTKNDLVKLVDECFQTVNIEKVNEEEQAFWDTYFGLKDNHSLDLQSTQKSIEYCSKFMNYLYRISSYIKTKNIVEDLNQVLQNNLPLMTYLFQKPMTSDVLLACKFNKTFKSKLKTLCDSIEYNKFENVIDLLVRVHEITRLMEEYPISPNEYGLNGRDDS